MNEPTVTIDRILNETEGILKLKPNYARRSYKDGGRLGLPKRLGAALGPSARMWYSERWLASTVTAANPNPIPGEGLSFLDVPGKRISLKEAVSVRPEAILGPELAAEYGPQFPVLTKILDPYDPVGFHFHARDEDVKKFPNHFRGHKAGKDEAYYFLPKPRGRVPYLHLGLQPGVTLQDLERAARKGSEHVLDLSPVFVQRSEEGFYIPAGVLHRPGTALTLEIQQPSDVYTSFEREVSGKKVSPQQMHPGFDKLEDALKFLDLALSSDPQLPEKCRLLPELIPDTRQHQGGEESWIFPPRLTHKFSGKRLRVTGTFETAEESAYLLLIWSGSGELDGRPIKAGEEYLMTYSAARTSHALARSGVDTLEVFKIFPPRAQNPERPHQKNASFPVGNN